MSDHGDRIRAKLAELAAADEENRCTTGDQPRTLQVLAQEFASYVDWFEGAVNCMFQVESFDTLNDTQTALSVAYLDEQIAEVRECTARRQRWDDESEYGGLSDFLERRSDDLPPLPAEINAKLAELNAAVMENRTQCGGDAQEGADGVTDLMDGVLSALELEPWADFTPAQIAIVLRFLDWVIADVRKWTGAGLSVSEEPQGICAGSSISYWDNALVVFDDLQSGREPGRGEHAEDDLEPAGVPGDGISFID